jgi:D-inositol-3-phosphate glycosyltransferase
LKIYIIGPAYPYRGGIADSGMRMGEEFMKMGHEVDFINFSLQYPNFLFPGTTQYSSSPAPKHLKIRRLINAVNPLNWIKVGKLLKKEQPAIVFVRYWLPFMAPALGTICKIIKSNKHTKVVAIPDNLIPHEARIGDKQFTGYFIKHVDKIVTLSKDVANDAQKISTKPVITLPHPIYDIFGNKIKKDKAKALFNLSKDTKTILFFGLIRDYKGLDLLLKAMADEDIKLQKIKLIVAGEYYADPKKYEELIDELNIRENLILHTHFIPTEEVYKYFSAADVVAQPYKSATQSGITQIAFHFSTPMIVTNVGGLPEVVRHNELGLVVERDPKQLANAIKQFFNQALEERFTIAMQQEKAKYEWSYFANNILEFAKK